MVIKSAFQVVLRALKGEKHDYTQGKISEAVILLAIPMILELGLESVFAVVDMFFVSGLGANAIATVGLTEAVVTLVYSVAMGLSIGASAIVARRTGEKNSAAVGQAAAQSILLALIASLFISGVGIVFSQDILRLMGASAEVVKDGAGFMQILLGGNLMILLLFLINGIFRGVGDATMAMRSLWLASGVNIVLCPVLIHFYGVQGAAMATVIGRGSGVIFQCYHIFGGKSSVLLRRQHFNLDLSSLRHIFTVAWPASLQFLIGSGSWILITRMVAESGGTAASAGAQIAFRIFVFFMLPAWGLSNAAATLMGQNLGAKEYDRAEESVWLTVKYTGFFMAAVMLVLLIFTGPAVRIFTQDSTVLAYAISSLRIIATGFVFFGFGMVLTQAINGAGDTKTPNRFNVVCFWCFQLPLAHILVYHTDLKAMGALIAVPIAHVLLTLISWRYFKLGRWKKIQV